MPVKPEQISKAVTPGPNLSLWSTAPQIHARTGKTYYGRVFVEVWDKDALIACCGDSSLQARGLAALQGHQKAVQVASTPWTSQPALGLVPGQTFLGRVVIEIWQDQAVVAMSGAASQVLANAINVLSAGQ